MLKKIIILLSFILCIGVSLSVYNWINAPMSAVDNHCSIDDLVDDMDAFNKAISKMGPHYQYVITPKGDLYVNRGDGKWLKLKYRKGESE